MDPADRQASFENALEAALGQGPGPAEPIADAWRDVAVKLPLVDNLGRTGDDRDLYPHIDNLCAAARAAYPELLCKAGCSACCHYPVALYTISEAEWRPMVELIERTWPRERLVAFVRAFWESHGPYMLRLRVLSWLMAIPLPVIGRREAIPLACPFLENDRCAVYEARPAQARAFGMFVRKPLFHSEQVLYGCEQATEHMKPILARGDRRGLPNFDPIFGVLMWLARGRKRLIPVWFARQWPRKWLAGQAGTGPAVSPPA